MRGLSKKNNNAEARYISGGLMNSHACLQPLKGSQSLASHPEDHVWLSASAGTGKTHVLTARVFRLLLRPDVSPENILCLTFTKAGAAEMAERRTEASRVGKECVSTCKSRGSRDP